MKQHLNIKVYGSVQGVFYRHSAKREAGDLNITGFARNEPDGSVYIEVEGEEENLKKFLEWCREGPPSASVKKIESKLSSELKEFPDFTIE